MSTPNQLGFFNLANRYDALSQQGDPLERLAHHIPWAGFRPTLEKTLRRSNLPKGGRPPYDVVLMFKLLVLQALFNLSNDQTEHQICDRLSFICFLGLDLHQWIPDAKTIWLFRETLAQAGVVERLFHHFGRSLAKHGLQGRGGQVIDASLVPVPTQRNTRRENAAIQAGDCPAEWEAQPAKRHQKDTQVRWTVKHGVNHYGYKIHVIVDRQPKLIRRYTVTDAAVHDSQVLEDVLLTKAVGREVWAGAAYRSHEIETHLRWGQLRSRIPHKGYRHTRLTARQKARNQKQARTRARVELGFGHHVMAMGGKLIRTIGLVRALAKIGLRDLAYNFHRFLWLMLSGPRHVA